jgi:FHA domain/Double zinc ribbon
MAIYCLNCGVSLPDGVAFCDACGTPVRGQNQGVAAGPAQTAQTFGSYSPGVAPMGGAGSVACPVCGAAALPGEAFCDNCGAALLSGSGYSAGPSAMPAAPAVPAAALEPEPAPQYSQAPLSTYAPPIQKTAYLVVTSPAPPATLSIPDRPELIVGRSDPQSNSYPDVDLGPYGGLDLGVSRRHMRLFRNGDQFYVEDLNSVNGVIVNGQRIASLHLHPLSSGDRLALGKMVLTFEMS